ncbi:DUF805 domain-containing protein [Sphingomonas sp. Leaf62]|uniref:DUF805 domain-containing protein n=1 Tax=Sphingomonas sp. Leaf62 TaxID=1736228 RepID=UPI0007018E44|nr:DUF805 domain-containing protein [Sphingomonas sp. Leaf62]KQN71811.1 hypothetical protein ASE91_03635 [Sphingomonas sp. Leaf62]
MEWMLLPLNRYFEVRGRSRRMEYWMFSLFSALVGVVATIIDSVFGFDMESTGPVGGISSIALFIPGLTVAFRRLHDTDRSAWWMLLVFLPIIGWIWLFVLFVTDGTPGPNRFGADPKDPYGSVDIDQVFS